MLDVTTTGPNWPQIKTDYEAGKVSIRQIAAREGISDTAVHKRARSEGWNAGLRKPDGPASPTTAQTKVQTALTPAGALPRFVTIRCACGHTSTATMPSKSARFRCSKCGRRQRVNRS